MGGKMNILLLLADDQRFDMIGSIGNTAVRTPNLDKLVSNGTTFTQCHIPGGTVGAVCMPSRAMLHTGRTLFHLEKDGQSIPRDHVLLGERLKREGYRTVGIGKWHNGREAFARSFMDGGEIFFGGMTDHWNVPAYHYDPTGKYDAVLNMIKEPMTSNDVIKRPCDHITSGKHSSELFADFAVKWMEDHKESDQPFFMSVSFLAPHDPRSMPEEFRRMYDPDQIELPENFLSEHPFPIGVEHIRDEMLASYPRDEAEIRRHIAEYYGMISHLDHEVGKVLEALERSGKRDNTLVVFAGDNGLAVGQHGLMGKQNVYEHSVRVPLILAGPGIPRSERRDAYVYLLDLYPTLCELLGISIPDSVEGSSFAPIIKGEKEQGRDSLYLVYGELIRGVKQGGWKLVEYRNGGEVQEQLFDLDHDPGERVNLIGRSEAAEQERILRAELERLRREWEDVEHPASRAFWNDAS